MYFFIWDNALDQQQRAQLEANHIYDGMSPVSHYFTGYLCHFLAQKLYRLSRHCEYPNAVTSLANSIYNSIPKTYIDSLQLMQQKFAQYSRERRILAHPRVTKANFMSYLEAVHRNDVAFLEPIGDLEVDDEGIGKPHRLFDE
jgi:hypothetical protein